MGTPNLDRPSNQESNLHQQTSDSWVGSAASSAYEGIKKAVQNPYVDGAVIGIATAAAVIATRGKLGSLAKLLPEAEALLPKASENVSAKISESIAGDAASSFNIARASLGRGESQLSLGARYTEVNWSEALKALRTQGESPVAAFGRAARTSRIVGLGETHVPSGELLDQIRDHAGTLMPTLQINGITHLGVELPTVTKPIFDAFNAGKNQLELPALLSGEGGENALHILNEVKNGNPQLVRAWMQAREAGIRVVPLDVNGAFKLGEPLTDSEREMFLRDNVLNILSVNPENKVFAWLGNMHMADSKGAAGVKSAAEILRGDVVARGENMTTFGSVIDHWGERSVFQTTSTPLTHAVDRAISIPTTNVDGSLNGIGKIPLQKLKMDWGRHHFPEQPFDNLIVHPSPVRGKIVESDDLRKLEGGYTDRLIPKMPSMPGMIAMPKPGMKPTAGDLGHLAAPTMPFITSGGAGHVNSTAEGLSRYSGPERMKHVDYYSAEVKRLVPGDQSLRSASYRYMMHQAGVDNYASSLEADRKLIEQSRSGLKDELDKLVEARKSNFTHR